MLKRLHENRSEEDLVTIIFEGEELKVPAVDTVIAAVMAAGAGYNRTSPISGEHRSAYCHMGVCYECLMEIDGIPNQQACKIQVRDGMVINRQYSDKDIANG